MNPRWLAVLAVALIAVACSSTPQSSASPVAATSASESASASASASESASVGPSASAPASGAPSASTAPSGSGVHLPDDIVDTMWIVLVTDLLVRTEPSTADPATIREGGLSEGDVLLAVDGPVSANGYEWIQVLPVREGGLLEKPFGWIAVSSREGEAWIRQAVLSCPDPATDANAFLDLAAEERLACYGDRTIEFQPTHGGCGAGGGPVTYEPDWIMSLSGCSVGPTADRMTLALRYPPDSAASQPPPAGATVVGHHDDAAAATCIASSSHPAVAAPSREEAIAICRTQFVIEAINP